MIYFKKILFFLVSMFGFLLFLVTIASSECSPCDWGTILYMYCPYPSTFCLTTTSALSALGSIVILSILFYKTFIKLPIIETNKYNADSLVN